MGSSFFNNSTSLLNHIFIILTIYTISHNAQPNTTTYQTTTTTKPTTFITTPALTVLPLVVGFLDNAMGGKYPNMTDKYCEWDVPLMIHLINETDPTFLTQPSTKALLLDSGYLPEYIIRQFPPQLLSFYGLNYTEPISEECGHNQIIGTPPPLEIDFCVGPLVHTDLVNPVNEDAEVKRINLKNVTGLDMFLNASLSDCGLSCEAGAQVYALTDGEQTMVDMCKIIGVTLCFIAIIFSTINQYIDQKRTGKKFVNKPLLQIIPFLITFALFMIVLLMTLGEIIGKESIVCYENEYENDGDDKRVEFTFFNPIQGKNWACTVHGIFFYGALNLYQCYTVLLSFVIFRQLYAPMRPLWDIPQKYWHIGCFAYVILMDIFSIISSSYGGVWPMGICLPGPSINKYLLIFVVIPFFLSFSSSLLLLFLAAYFLRKELNKQKQVANKDSTLRIQDLLHRLIYYGIGVNACLLLLCITALKFYLKSNALSDDMNKTIECEVSKLLLDPMIECPARTVKMSPFYFISWIIAAILGVGAQIILSCHNEARDRLKRAATLNHVGSKLDSLKNKMKDKTKSKSGDKSKDGDENMITSTSHIDSPRSKSQPHDDITQNMTGVTITPMPFIGSQSDENNTTKILERVNSGSEDENGTNIELVSVDANNTHNGIGNGIGSIVQDSMIPVHSEEEDITVTSYEMQ